MTEETKKCPYCAEIIMADALLCKHCKSNLGATGPGETIYQRAIPVQVEVVKDEKSKKGMGLASIIVGGFGAFGGLNTVLTASSYPIPTVTSGESAILFIFSAVSLGLAIGAKVKKQKLSTPALIVSIASTVLWQLSYIWAIPSPLG